VITLILLDAKQKNSPQTWTFEQELLIRIGRSAENHVVLNDPLVSRHHVELSRVIHSAEQEVWQLRSQGTNGTFLDGKLVSQGLLCDGCLVQLGLGGPLLKIQMHQTAAANPNHCDHKGNPPSNLFCIRCGQPIHVQQTIRNYQVLRSLGTGDTSRIYLVWHPKPLAGRPALQVLQEIEPQGAVEAEQTFAQSARLLQSLNHPRIPQFFDAFTEAGQHYLVRELVHAQDLDRWMKQHGSASPQQAITWMLEVCEVLDYLHCQVPPLIHRGIKPSNLLVRNRDQQITVVGFNPAQSTTQFLDQVAELKEFTPGHNRAVGPQSDLEAVGETLLFLLTGSQGRQLALQDYLALPSQLRAVIERSTPSSRNGCYQTALELAQALKACL